MKSLNFDPKVANTVETNCKQLIVKYVVINEVDIF